MNNSEPAPLQRNISDTAIFPLRPTQATPRTEGETLAETLQRVRRVLRGQYRWIVGLGLFGAVIGATAGWFFAPLTYRSEGLLRIAYEMPQVFQDNDANRPMARFDSYLQSQKLLITSRRMIDLAVQNSAWYEAGKDSSPDAVAEYGRNLDVLVSSGNEYIRIAYTDRDPAIAAAGARAMVNAYAKVYNGEDEHVEDQIQSVAKQHKEAIEQQIGDIDAKIQQISANYGTPNLDSLHDAAVQRYTKLQTALADLQLVITQTPTTMEALTPEQALAQSSGNDGVLRKFYDDLAQKQTQLEVLKNRYGVKHPRYQDAVNELAATQKMFDQYIQQVGKNRASSSSAGGVTTIKNRASLLAEEEEVKDLLADARNDMVTIAQKRAEIAKLNKTRDDDRDELLKVTRRIDSLQAESALGGRLSVVSAGEIPVTPLKDYRKYAAAAGVLGFGFLPSAVVLLYGMVRGRYRYSEDAHVAIGAKVPLLGILPRLKNASSKQDALAAQSIHQIRVLLQSTNFGNDSRVFMITSAAPGEGKTSLTLSLALSFAGSHVRTLVIDCDLAARRLTKSLNCGDQRGLPEALAAGHTNGFVQDFGGLSILTAGAATSLDASTLGTRSMQALISSARKEYDVVLIDTGPILGSVEAALAAREVDGAILTISAGQAESLVARSLERLRTLRTNVVGAVFNRADAKDFGQAVYASSYSEMLKKEREHPAGEPVLTCPFGPLVRAVLASLSRTTQLALH